MSSRLPNFIIGGAPKCGTTSLANYLRDHPQAFVSNVKEPFFFAEDLPSMKHQYGIATWDDYRRLFADAEDRHRAVGEGSTLYLFSDVAIEKALEALPDVKFIFMLRRPDKIAHAYHMQMGYYENESEPDFETAWKLQACRREGGCRETIPPRCEEPRLLQYREVASIGTQLERAFRLIPESRRRVFLFDDFVADVGSVYRDSIAFLGLDDDGRTEFAKDNAAMKARSVYLSRMLRSSAFRSASQFFKRTLPPSLGRLARDAKVRLTTRPAPRAGLNPSFEADLINDFLPEIEKVEALLGRDLSEWKSPSGR